MLYIDFSIWPVVCDVYGRRSIPAEFSVSSEDDTEALVPRVRARLSPTPRRRAAVGRRSASQHVVQAFHLLHRGVQPDRQEGADAAAGPDWHTECQGPAVISAVRYMAEHVAARTLWCYVTCEWTAVMYAVPCGMLRLSMSATFPVSYPVVDPRGSLGLDKPACAFQNCINRRL